MPKYEFSDTSVEAAPKTPKYVFTGSDQPKSVVDKKREAGEKSLIEAADVAMETLPTIGAIAMAQFTPAGPAVDAALAARFGGPMAGRFISFLGRTIAAGTGGELGGAAEQSLRAASGINAPKSIGEALQKSHQSGMEMMKYQVGGEIAGGVTSAVTPHIQRGIEGVTNIMRRSLGGRMIQQQADKATAMSNAMVVEKANAAADEALQALGPKVQPEQMSARAETMLRRTRDAMNTQAQGIYDMQKVVLEGHTADLVPAAKAILNLESTIPRYKGTFKPITKLDPEWETLIERAKVNSEPRITEVPGGVLKRQERIGTDALTGKPIYKDADVALPKKELSDVPMDSIEDARALVDARGKINKRIWDLKEAERAGEPVNREYIAGLQKVLDLHDGLIRSKLKEVGGDSAERLVDSAKNFFAAQARINEQMYFKTLRKDPSRVVDMILADSGKGEGVRTVAHLEAAAKAAGMQDFLPEVRRKWLEGMITDKNGKLAIFDLEPALTKYGRTAQAMMRGPEEKAILERLRKIAEDRSKLKDIPKIDGGPHLDWLIHGAISGAIGTMVGRDTGVGAGFLASGGSIAATIGVPAMMVMIANHPGASSMFRRGMKGLADSEPSAGADIARAVNLAWKGGKAQYLALQGIGQMMASHEQAQP